MRYHKESFSSYYQEMSGSLRGFALPRWEDFPDLELYMDQMTAHINRYLAFQNDERTVTASMINNYVKAKLIPRPVRKRTASPTLPTLSASVPHQGCAGHGGH